MSEAVTISRELKIEAKHRAPPPVFFFFCSAALKRFHMPPSPVDAKLTQTRPAAVLF